MQSLVLSIINYCIRIWGTTNQTILNAAQKLQNFAAKVAISGAKKYDHVTPIMKELKWIKVKEQHQLVTCTAVFKTLNDFDPIWFKQFPSVRDVTNCVTRQRNLLYVPQTKTDAGARKFSVLGPKMWNGLPHCYKCGLITDF